jgi:hypothetical protein
MNNTLKKNNTLTNSLNKLNNKINNKSNKPQQINIKLSNNTPSTGYSGSNVIGIILLIVVLIVIASASYWLYNYYTTRKFETSITAEVLPDVKDAMNKTALSSNTIPSSSYSNEYSISFWVNIQDYNYKYGDEKIILRRGASGSGNPEIFLDGKKNDLIVRVKLQGMPNSISKFEDIPIKLPSQNTGIGSIQPESVQMATNNSNMSDDLSKISSNNIDYPTIKYTFDNNLSNSECGYFDLISGNSVNANANSNGNSNGNSKIVEGFTDIDDATNASVKVIVDICNIAKTIQGQQLADDSVDSINTGFQSLIDALEKSKTSAKSVNDITIAFESLSSNISISPQQTSSVLSQQFNTLKTDIQTLATFSTVKITDYTALANSINAQMTANNCPITINGTSDIDTTISFYENIINLLKKSLLTYINNMGSGIKKIYPELNNGSCMIETSGNNDPTVGMCVAKMIPLQKWVCVIVSIYNQIIDIYIDGQLSSSCVLKGFPAISTDEVNITPDGGFSGKISRVAFSNTAMTVTNARQIYYSGPVASDSLFSMIPNWIYWLILIIIIVAIGYSFLM